MVRYVQPAAPRDSHERKSDVSTAQQLRGRFPSILEVVILRDTRLAKGEPGRYAP
jgi:hypothetical protein